MFLIFVVFCELLMIGDFCELVKSSLNWILLIKFVYCMRNIEKVWLLCKFLWVSFLRVLSLICVIVLRSWLSFFELVLCICDCLIVIVCLRYEFSFFFWVVIFFWCSFLIVCWWWCMICWMMKKRVMLIDVNNE